MGLFRDLGLFIAWLAGSLGGITAIFYACGYLVTLSNLRMLGVDLFALSYDPAFYMQRGAGFFVLSVVSVVSATTNVVVMLIVLIPLWIVIRTLKARAGRNIVPARWSETLQHNATLLQALAFALLLLAMFLFVMRLYTSMQEHLGVSDVMTATPEIGGSPAQKRLREWIVESNHPVLEEQFSRFVYSQMAAAVIMALAWHVTKDWNWRPLWIFPFALLFGMSAASLPLVYGVLIVPNEFSEIVLVRNRNEEQNTRQVFYLLNKTESEFVVWAARERKVIWVPAQNLSEAMIGRRRSLREIRDQQE